MVLIQLTWQRQHRDRESRNIAKACRQICIHHFGNFSRNGYLIIAEKYLLQQSTPNFIAQPVLLSHSKIQ